MALDLYCLCIGQPAYRATENGRNDLETYSLIIVLSCVVCVCVCACAHMSVCVCMFRECVCVPGANGGLSALM